MGERDPRKAGVTASAYFGGMVESYDSLIRRAVPRYDEMTDRLMDYTPARAARILELGCGTGNLTLKLAERFHDSAFTVVDAAPEMTAMTMDRLASRVRASAITDRFEALDFAPGSFDLVTSSMSLHHVADKSPLYRAVHAWLRPGGCLLVADQFLGAAAAVQEIHWARWLEFCRMPGNCTTAEVESLIAHAAAHDHYEPLVLHFRMLTDVGFGSVDCVWRDRMYAVVIANKT